MRRFWAFIIMLVTVLFGVVFCGQPIIDNMVYSTEFGGGREVVYQLTQREENKKFNSEKIGEQITARLDKAGVKNAHVEFISNDRVDENNFETAELRITFAPMTTSEFDNAKLQVKTTGPLSVCNQENYCLDGSEFFEANPARVLYQGTTAYPGFKIVSEVAAKKFSDTLGTDENNIAYIWQNRNPDSGIDDYEHAFGDDYKEEIRRKVVGAVTWESGYQEKDLLLLVPSNITGSKESPFTLSSARAFASAFNSSDYGFDIVELYDVKVDPSFGANAVLPIVLGLGITLLLIAICMVVLYGASGATTFVSLVATLAVSIFVFSFLGFEMSPSAIMGLVATIILAVFTSLNYLEKVKDELKKGRTVAKANQEGYRKSFFVTLDSCAILFFVALFTFLFGKGIIKTFGGVMFIGAIVVFIVNNFLNKWMLYWLTTSNIGKEGLMGFRVKKFLEDKKFYNEPSDNKKRKIGGIVGFSAVILATVGLISTGLTTGVFNNGDDFAPSQRLSIKTIADTDDYRDQETFKAYLVLHGINVDYEDMIYERVTKKDEFKEDYEITYISFLLEKGAADAYIGGLREILIADDDKATIDYRMTQVVNVDHDTSSFLLVYGLSILFAAIYFFLRFGISAFLTYLTSGTIVGLSGLAIFSVLRLPFNSIAYFGLLGVLAVLSFSTIAIFGRNKDTLKDMKILRTASSKQRAEVLNSSFINSLPATISIGVIALAVSVVIIASSMGGMMLPLFLAFALVLILGLSFFIYFNGPFYLFLKDHIRFKKWDWTFITKHFKRKKKKIEINKNEPHETIVMGLNDFR